ncbi:MAG: hypothetical protein U9O59_07585 [Actinomycetota bacterium]|nr:hypothetical protein [Actinomycetota bacterium]
MMLFFFMLLYLFVLQKDFFRRPGSGDPGKEFKVPARSKILNIIIPFLCCAAAGYFIYEYVSGFLKGVKVAEDGGNIFIADWSDISNYFFTNYSLVLIIITASLFMSFLWFLAVKAREK